MSSIYSFPITENNLQQHVVHYTSAFSIEECQSILDAVANKTAIAGQIVKAPDSNAMEKQVRNVSVQFLEYEDAPQIYDRICQYVLDANQSHFKADLTGFLESMQILHYGEDIGGGHYNWHIDNGPGLSTRKLTVIIQLSDPADYTGCQLQVSGCDHIPTQQGSVIIFPSYTPHRVTQLDTGNRNALVVWVNGPPYK